MRFVVVGCEWVWEWLLAVGVYWWSLASACQSTWSTQWSPVKTCSLALHSLCKFILLWKSLRTCWCGLCRWLRRSCLLKTHQSASASKSSSCVSHSKAGCYSANPPPCDLITWIAWFRGSRTLSELRTCRVRCTWWGWSLRRRSPRKPETFVWLSPKLVRRRRVGRVIFLPSSNWAAGESSRLSRLCFWTSKPLRGRMVSVQKLNWRRPEFDEKLSQLTRTLSSCRRSRSLLLLVIFFLKTRCSRAWRVPGRWVVVLREHLHADHVGGVKQDYLEDLWVRLNVRQHFFRNVRADVRVFVLFTQNVILHHREVIRLEVKSLLALHERWVLDSKAFLTHVSEEVDNDVASEHLHFFFLEIFIISKHSWKISFWLDELHNLLNLLLCVPLCINTPYVWTKDFVVLYPLSQLSIFFRLYDS